jgi:hypothetical protein
MKSVLFATLITSAACAVVAEDQPTYHAAGRSGQAAAGQGVTTAGQGGSQPYAGTAGQPATAGKGGQGGNMPTIVKDGTRQVVNVTLVATDKPINACATNVTKYLTQFHPKTGACGELPDEKGDYSGMKFLGIPANCTLGHFYNVDEACTVTTDLTCNLDNGCTETRYLDYTWRHAQIAGALTTDEALLGDGELKYTRSCPNKPECADTYTQITFNQL